MSFRAKMFVTGANKQTEFEGNPFVDVNMIAVYESTAGVEGNAAEENKIFGKWTPSASFNARIYDPNVIEQLEQGKQFYVDFTPTK